MYDFLSPFYWILDEKCAAGIRIIQRTSRGGYIVELVWFRRMCVACRYNICDLCIHLASVFSVWVGKC